MLYENLEDTEAGTKFEQDILAELRKVRELYIFPFSDTRAASREGDVRFINPQPSDFCSVLPNGKACFIEAKASRKYDCLYDGARKAIRPNQAAAARRTTRNNGVYVFLFLDRVAHKLKAYDGGAMALFFHKKVTTHETPILEGSWADREEFCTQLISKIVEPENGKS